MNQIINRSNKAFKLDIKEKIIMIVFIMAFQLTIFSISLGLGGIVQKFSAVLTIILLALILFSLPKIIKKYDDEMFVKIAEKALIGAGLLNLFICFVVGLVEQIGYIEHISTFYISGLFVLSYGLIYTFECWKNK